MFNDPRRILKKYGLVSKKYLSQNFLISPKVVNKMASFAHGTVLEIGPGCGTLTDELSKLADNVIAIEKDPKLAHILEEEYAWDNVEIINADVLETTLPNFDVCISSVPYSISSPLIFKLLECKFEYLVLLLQKEFAQKLTTINKPSRLTIMANSYTDTKEVLHVPRTKFFPSPKVDSTVVQMLPNKKIVIDESYKSTVLSLFTHKRKTVRNALIDGREIFNKDKKEIKEIVATVPYADTRVMDIDVYKAKEISSFISNIINDKDG